MTKDAKKIAPPSLLDDTRNLLRRAGLVARKRLGQHFLVDEEVLAKILAAAGVSSGDTVIEVGPGLGILTVELTKRAKEVVAVELDDNLAALLKETLVGLPNVRIINRDILDVEPEELLEGESPRYRVIANLPYYITAPVFRHFLEAKIKPESMVVMVQKEVARNIIAGPGDLSLLALSIQFYAEPKLVTYVPASSFYPPPKIDSAVLRLEILPRPRFEVGDPGRFFGLVKAGFSAPRKQLLNSLSGGLGKTREEISAILEKAKIDSKRRAEMLSLEEWANLWRVYSNEKP
ncbi:MAG: ribosomal RNA small subunit methyltransferase A [Dehalococcoidia bacterium]|jgi:16S rRNA (adenine1518-N6/adenine1519-N6)-dimethyltransferase|nr:MAG: ribosomal RNA small subunit methyltransferase A [Dehalococcoidia bacterium]